MKLSPLSSDPPLQKDSHKQILLCGAPFSSQVSPLSFFPKESLNGSRNPIPVWRKSQIFRFQLTDDFGPFNVIIRTFGKLQSCSPLSYFHPNLNHLNWISEPKVMPKILTDVQAGIQIWIGLGFNWVGLLLNSCLAGCKLVWFNWLSPLCM